MSQTKIRPLDNRIVIEREEAEKKTPGGIIIPDTAGEKPMIGKVIACGLGKRLDNGDRLSLEVNVGDRVLFGKYAGTEVEISGKKVVVMREDDIMGIVEG